MRAAKFNQCLFLLLLSIFYSALSFATTLDCRKAALQVTDLARPTQLLECLEEYAQEQLKPGSSADEYRKVILEDIFDKEEARVRSDNTYNRGLQRDQITGISMHQYYRLSFPTISVPAKNKQITDGLCFDLSKIGNNNTKKVPRHRRGRIFTKKASSKQTAIVVFAEKMMKQIDEVAKFIAHFHAITLGGESSLLFHPRQIKFCDQNKFYYYSKHNIDRRMIYFDQSINLGVNNMLNPEDIKVLSSSELMDLWNEGDQIRVVPKAYNYDLKKQSITEALADHASTDFQERVYGFQRDGQSSSLITEFVAKYWSYLNPAGSIRSKARYFLTGAIHRSLNPKPIDKNGTGAHFRAVQYKFDYLVHEYKEAFAEENIKIYNELIRNDKQKLLDFNQRFMMFALSPSRISQSIEGTMASKAKDDLGMILQFQHQTCFIGVTNNHTILTMVDFLLSDKDENQQRFINYGKSEVDFSIEKQGSLFSSSMKMSYKGDGSTLTNLQANLATQFSWICTNTTDKVRTSITVPTMSSKAYKAYSMNKLIDEIKSNDDDLIRYF